MRTESGLLGDRAHSSVSYSYPRFSSEGETAAFTSVDRATLVARLRAAGIAFGAINDVAGLSAHPALRRVEVDSPTGPVAMAAPPARFDGAVRALGPVPGIGEQTEAIRKEFSE